jgi:hypothetical protein
MIVYKLTLPQLNANQTPPQNLEDVHADFVEEALFNFQNCSATARATFVVEELEGGEDEEQRVDIADIIEYRINASDESKADVIKELAIRYGNLCGKDHVSLNVTSQTSVEIRN